MTYVNGGTSGVTSYTTSNYTSSSKAYGGASTSALDAFLLGAGASTGGVEYDLMMFLATLNKEASGAIKDKMEEMKRNNMLSKTVKSIENSYIQNKDDPNQFSITAEKLKDQSNFIRDKSIKFENSKLQVLDKNGNWRNCTEDEKNCAVNLGLLGKKDATTFLDTGSIVKRDNLTKEQRDFAAMLLENAATVANGGIPLKEEAILQAELNMAVQRLTSTTTLVSDAGKKLESLFKKIAEDFPQ